MTEQIEKKENRKVVIKFFIILALCMTSGGAAGYLMGTYEDTFRSFMGNFASMKDILIFIVPAVYFLLSAALLIPAYAIYFRQKKIAFSWDGEEEDVIESVEVKLNQPLLLVNISTIIGLLYMSILFELLINTQNAAPEQRMAATVGLILFVAAYALGFWLNKLIVDLEKKLNPEKRGNVFDMNFQKDWENSCDERQLIICGKAAFKAYKTANYVCMGMWLLCMAGQSLLNTGIFPMVCVTIIWMVLTVVYCLEAAKLERDA